MNWLYITIMGYIVISALRGFHKGFLKVVYSMAALLAIFLFVALTMPWISHMLQKSTPVYQRIEAICEDYVSKQAEQKLENGTLTGIFEIPGVDLPSALDDALAGGTKESVLNLLETQGVYQKIARVIAVFCINAIAFVISLLIISLIVIKIGRWLDAFSKVPGIHLVNMILGFFAGVVKAFVVIWILFLVVEVTAVFPTSARLIQLIEESAVLKNLYDNNRLLELLQQIPKIQ